MVRQLPLQKNATTPTQQEKSFEELTALLAKINPELLCINKHCKIVLWMGVRLNKFDEIEDDFNTLQAQSNVPAYLEEAFGDYWAAKRLTTQKH